MPFYFEQPNWFLIVPVLLIIKLVASLFLSVKTMPQRSEVTSVLLPVSDIEFSAINKKSTHSKLILYWVAIILMTIALAQPVNKIKIQSNPDTLRDIIFVIDTSVGMSINDYTLDKLKISRLTLLKAVLTDFVDKLEGNRIGLMVYADQAHTLTPLTRDKGLLTYNINRVSTAIAGRQNNLSNALNTILKNYDLSTKKPSIVIMSQGANIEGDVSPLKAAEYFKERNIKLHFIGLGSSIKTTENTINLLYDPIDDKLLKKLSEITSGEFFWAGKSENLTDILNAIKKSEQISIKKSSFYKITNHYHLFLYIVLFLFFGISLFTLLPGRFK